MANPNGNPETLAAPFEPGKSGNPGGKPKAARNRLQGAFLNALADDFDAHGVKAIRRARLRDPMGYVKAVAALMPKQVEASQPLDDLTDAELLAGIALLRGRLAEPARAGVDAADQSKPTH